MANVAGIILSVYGLPPAYADIGYGDTCLSKAKQDHLEAKVPTAPNKGTLTVTGTAAPIVNQLIGLKRVVRGINFLDRSTTAFEAHENPKANVVVLFNVGMEVSLNAKVSGMVLRSIVQHYAEQPTLLIIETKLSRTELLSRYDFRVANHTIIPKKEDESWL